MELNLGNDVSSMLKRDGALLGLAGALKAYLVKHSKTANIGSKINVKKLGKALGYVELANAASTTVQDLLPHVSEALDWSMALPFNILNQTLGRIPVIGAIFRAVHNFVTNTVTTVADWIGLDGLAVTGSKLILKDPNEGFETETDFSNPGKKYSPSKENEDKEGDEQVSKSKLLNGPNFYENLDLHKTFSIPGAYTKKTVVNGTLATPKLAVHRIYENPMPDRSAIIDRLNQKFALIKAVRGLSATNYNIIDLFNYERFAKLVLLEYYVIKKVVQAAKTYSLVQTSISDNIISSLGFVPSEVRDNLANYETLLCQVHRFIANNLPVSGTWVKRLEYLVGANVPDYSDPKVATIHMFAVSMSNVYTSRKDNTGRVFDCIPESGNNSYAVLLQNFTDYQTDLVANDYWQQLIADYFGAFGAQAMWQDKDYPAYTQPLNLRNSDNDLCREQIKNGFYLNAKMGLITINAGVANKKIMIDVDDPSPIQYTSYTFPNTFDSSVISSGQNLTYNNILDNDSYLLMASGQQAMTLGDTNKLLVPDHNGVGAQCFDVIDGGTNIISMNNHETIYTLHKDNYSEGEALEISQFKSRCLGMYFSTNDSQDKYFVVTVHKTHEYALLDTVMYVFGSNGSNIVDQCYTVCDEAISDDDLQNSESAIDFPDEIMAWALTDWMPLTHFTFFGYDTVTATYYPRDIACIDMDAFGSLDDRAFATSINYSIYSLQAAGLVVGKKRIDNLGAVYRDKASRKG